MRHYGRRFSVAVSLGLAGALLASACSSSSNAGSNASSTKSAGSGPELTHITVGVLPIIDSAPFFIAQKDGYFKQEGLTVTTKVIEHSTDAVPDMLHGSIAIIGGGNYVSFFQGETTHAFKINVVAPAVQCAPNTVAILALPKSGITKPADLAGKTVAVGLTHSILTLTANAVLEADNVNPATVHYTKFAFPDMIHALGAHSVAAISAVEPFVTGAEEALGAVPVLDQCTGPTANLPFSGYFAEQSWVKKYPKTALAFQRAIEKAAAAADSNHKLVQQILPSYTKISAKAAAVLKLPDFPSTLDATQLQRVADLMYSGKMLTKKFNVAPLIFH